MAPEVHVGPLDSLLGRLIHEIGLQHARALAARGFYAMALPGGSVAAHAFPALLTLALDWHRTHIFWVDERAVPPSDPDSNYAIAEARWLGPAGAPEASIHRMPADGPDLAAAAVGYGEELTRVLGSPPRLDVVLLGAGPDGHVASLFPGHAALSEERQLAVAVLDAPKPPTRRLTLTMPVLAGAERVVVMAFGRSKAAVIQEAVERTESSLPVALALRRARQGLVLVDAEAASDLCQYRHRR